MAPITPSTRKTTYNPVTPTTAFPVNFPIADNSDLKVTVNGAARTDFTVASTYPDGLSYDAVVNMNTAVTGAVIIYGKRIPRRQNQFQTGRPLTMPDLNAALNTLEIESQEARRDIDNNTSDIAQEIIDRGNAVAQVQANLDAETTDRIAGDSSLNAALVTEATIRALADTALASLIAQGGPIETAVFDSRLAVSFATIKPTIHAILTGGYSTAGDGGSWIAAEVDNTGDLLPGQQLSNGGTRRWELAVAKTGPVPATALGAFTGTAVQDAANYMQRNGGGEVYLPSGSVNIASATVNLPSQVSLRGGKGSHFRAGEIMDSLVSVAGGLTKIRGLVLDNPDGKAQYAITVSKPANNLPFELSDCYVASFAKAVRWLDGDCLILSGNTGVANGAFLDAKNDCRNSFISKNYILGGIGLNFEMATVGVNGFAGTPQGAEGVAVIQNIILPAINNAYCLGMNHMLNLACIGNVFDQVMDGGSCVAIDATVFGDGSITYADFSHNWFGRQAGKNAQFGLYMVGPCRHVSSNFNRYLGFQQAAIYGRGTVALPQIGFQSLNDKFSEVDKNARDIQLESSHYASIKGAFFGGLATLVEVADVTGRVDDCIWAGPLPNIALGLRYGDQGSGMVLHNTGSGTIPSGLTGIFNHGLSFTPSFNQFSFSIGSFTGNGTGDIVVPPGNITSTQFSVAPRIATGTTLSLGWTVDMRR